MSETTSETTSARQETPGRAARSESGSPEGRRTDAGADRRPPPRRRFQKRRKFCKFCADASLTIDHKNPDVLRMFITERSKIVPSRVTGNCAKHQRQLTSAIKRARLLALLPFTPLHHD